MSKFENRIGSTDDHNGLDCNNTNTSSILHFRSVFKVYWLCMVTSWCSRGRIRHFQVCHKTQCQQTSVQATKECSIKLLKLITGNPTIVLFWTCFQTSSCNQQDYENANFPRHSVLFQFLLTATIQWYQPIFVSISR